MSRVINTIRRASRRASRATLTMLYNCRLLDKKVRQMRGVDLGVVKFTFVKEFFALMTCKTSTLPQHTLS